MSDSRGFTLIELLVVIFIIGLLAATLYPLLIGPREDARELQTRALMQVMVEPMTRYAESHRGTYPPADTDGRDLTAGLVDALRPLGPGYPTDFARHPDTNEPVLADGWGNPITYRPWVGVANKSGAHNPRSYDLASSGADGIFGTEDDITNWR